MRGSPDAPAVGCYWRQRYGNDIKLVQTLRLALDWKFDISYTDLAFFQGIVPGMAMLVCATESVAPRVVEKAGMAPVSYQMNAFESVVDAFSTPRTPVADSRPSSSLSGELDAIQRQPARPDIKWQFNTLCGFQSIFIDALASQRKWIFRDGYLNPSWDQITFEYQPYT